MIVSGGEIPAITMAHEKPSIRLVFPVIWVFGLNLLLRVTQYLCITAPPANDEALSLAMQAAH